MLKIQNLKVTSKRKDFVSIQRSISMEKAVALYSFAQIFYEYCTSKNPLIPLIL